MYKPENSTTITFWLPKDIKQKFVEKVQDEHSTVSIYLRDIIKAIVAPHENQDSNSKNVTDGK